MSEELKPCPFCGESAFVAQHAYDSGYVEWHASCNCNSDCSCCLIEDTREDVVMAWNTRPVEDALRAENERLRADLREWQEAAIKSYGERCGTDEQHCTCVPLLRVEIERLRAENEVYLARITKLNGELYDAHNVIDTYKDDPTKALREIGYHDVEGFYSMEGKDEPE